MDRKTAAEQKPSKQMKMENFSFSGTEHRKLRVSELYRQSVMIPIVKKRQREIKGRFFLPSDSE